MMKHLIEKYPWLVVKDPYAGPGEEPTTFIDWIPEGWVKAFGEQLCEDLDKAINEAGIASEFQVDEAKEKYGSLSMYFGPTSKEVDAVERAYRAISETVCCRCGEIHGVKMVTRGWVSPYCRKCYGKITRNPDYNYFDNLPEETLPTTIRWSRFSKGGHETFEEDITETTNRIKENYKNRGTNNE